jgi:hypothetical protein
MPRALDVAVVEHRLLWCLTGGLGQQLASISSTAENAMLAYLSSLRGIHSYFNM